jgi:ATP-binding protein involved in chromosome partitioning
MAITEADVHPACTLTDPNTGKDFVSGKAQENSVGAGDIVVDLQLGYPAKSQHEAIRN